MIGRVARALRRLSRRGSRGATEAGVALVMCALMVGVLFGKGIADTAVSTSDGFTWLGDDPHGEVVQVNPKTGRPENRLRIAPPGDGLDIAQTDGVLIVTDRRTGVVTVIDVATLLVSGRLSGTGDGATEVLLDDRRIYVVDRSRGVVQRVDPASALDVGPEWSANGPLADAALDRYGAIWALRGDGRLFELTWSDPAGRLVEQESSRPVDGAGPRSVMVPHDQGVTVVGADGGVIVQIGTGHDLAAPAPGLQGPVHAAQESPADLVPISAETSSTVVIVNRAEVLEVDVGVMGCTRPGRPAVYHDYVYVPCLGDRKVIVLGRDGRRGRSDIATPEGGDPQLVLDDGRLIINVPGASSGIVVEPNGSTRTIRTNDDSVPVQDPADRPPPALPPPDRRPPTRDDETPRTNTPTPTPTRTPPALASPSATRTVTPPGVTPTATPTTGAPTAIPTTGPTTTTGPGPTTNPPPPGTTEPPAPPATTPPPPVITQPPPPTTDPPPPPPPTTDPPPPPPPTTDPPPPPPTVVPPSDAAATARDDGTVLVTWTPGTRPNAYRILRTDRGREVASTPADAGSATVTTVPPGETVAFVVEAVFDTGVARSEPSNSVTVFTWPDAPGGVDVSYVGDDGNEIAVRVAWSEPSDNGSPITHYVVDINADSGDRQVRTVTELRSGPMTLRCATPRCDGIRLEVRVNATNAAGDGPNGRAGYTHNAGPPPPPPVRDGDDVITGHSVDDLTVTVTFSGAWSSHPHQCAVLARGPIGVSDYISCDASSATLTLWRYGSYEFFMMALDPDSGRWIESAPEPVEVRMPRPPPPPPPCDPEPCAPLTGATESIVVGAATGFAGVVLLTRARYSRRTRQR